jgi:hypothetical protein
MGMPNHRSWNQLTNTEKEQVTMMLISLQEFSYGFERADAIADEVAPRSATLRFYMNSLYQYCCNYFLVGGANKLSNVLQSIGSGDLLEPVREVLDRTMGSSTFGEIIRTYRDKMVTHPNFTTRIVRRDIHSKFDLDDAANTIFLSGSVNDLFARTQELFIALAARFPEALGV